MIKKLQEETGAKIQFIQAKGEVPDDRTCLITGSAECVAEARQRIEGMIDSVVVFIYCIVVMTVTLTFSDLYTEYFSE